MHYNEDEYLMLSGIQHFAFCRRQWAIIHIESAWEDNYFTTDGILKHKRAHNPFLSEKRKDVITVGEMPVHSRIMGVSGKCDIVEFIRDETGVSLHGRSGLWLPRPVEYKRGNPKISDVDRLQLCAQAMCLEEMLLCPTIETAYLFYDETRRREEVPLVQALRDNVKSMFAEMHSYFSRRHTPRVKPSKACASCSLNDICLPKLPQQGSVASYINRELGGEI
ncbi:MAG: CRISPR-associated protein Cas4 [Defluviitaleaceae bacterium]|nr:CRISPR-associated protein Cas4 [Defluviitaleaceae bacterium]